MKHLNSMNCIKGKTNHVKKQTKIICLQLDRFYLLFRITWWHK